MLITFVLQNYFRIFTKRDSDLLPGLKNIDPDLQLYPEKDRMYSKSNSTLDQLKKQHFSVAEQALDQQTEGESDVLSYELLMKYVQEVVLLFSFLLHF